MQINKRGFIWLPILLAILIVLEVSSGAYWYEHSQSPTSVSLSTYQQASTTPATSYATTSQSKPDTTGVYYGDGYSVQIPSYLIYERSQDGTTDIWNSPNYDELISIEHGPNTPDSYERGLYDANVNPPAPVPGSAASQPQSGVILSHPQVEGATEQPTLIASPSSAPFTYSQHLYVIGDGNVYIVTGLSSSQEAQASVQKIIESFAITAQ